MSRLLGEYRQGDTWDILITFKSDDLPIDISGHTFTLTLVEDFDEAPVLQRTIVVSEAQGTQGICLIKVPPELTSAVPAGKFYWDVQEETPNGRITTVLPSPEEYKDRFVVRPDATDN